MESSKSVKVDNETWKDLKYISIELEQPIREVIARSVRLAKKVWSADSEEKNR